MSFRSVFHPADESCIDPTVYLAIAVVTRLVRVGAENVAYKYTHGFPHSRCQQNG